jgi:hypothetical protein
MPMKPTFRLAMGLRSVPNSSRRSKNEQFLARPAGFIKEIFGLAEMGRGFAGL